MSARGVDRVIVVVDDHAERAGALARAVEEARCGRARIAADAARATTLGSDADALLLRLDMADDAIQILRDLADSIDAGLPVLVVADEDDRAGRRRALAAGARDFVVAADSDYDELVLRLDNALEVRDIQTQLERRVGELEDSVGRAERQADE